MSDFQITDEISLFCKMKTWTTEECARIICGIPIHKKLNRSDQNDLYSLHVQVLLERADDDDLEYFRPLVLLNQLKELGVRVPDELFLECDKSDKKYYNSDIFKNVRSLKLENKKLSRKIERLEEQILKFGAKGRNTLYRIIHAAIRMKYKTPSAQDNQMVNELFSLVEEYEGAPQARTLNDALTDTLKYVNTLEKVAKASA